MANPTPYAIWETHELLGVFPDTKPETWAFGQFFQNQMRSDSEWIDFEKLPIRGRTLAPFVLPMGKGHGVKLDVVQGYRFKPANIVSEDAIDPLRPLTFAPGVDRTMLQTPTLDPMQRLDLITAQMTGEMVLSIERRWEHMKARAIIDGKLTITYLSGEQVLVDFRRDPGQTEVLTSGNYFGQSGVSIVDKIQQIVDTMNNADHGGMPVIIMMGGAVASVIRKDAEILSHLDRFVDGGTIVVERGVVSGANGGGKVYKFGNLLVGGASGQMIELWVNNETYTDVTGAQVRYLGNNEMVFCSTPEAINGYECFGRIVDVDAMYQPIPIFPKMYRTGDRVKTTHLSFESAPLPVPINPNATYKLTPIAAS